jgi:glycosyltransferase involved in cell wall biosynthesis
MTVAGSPLVSAIVPAYNAELFVEQTLRSLLAQTYENFEIIVVDDGSTDRTADRVESLARKHPQIRLVQQSNMGVAAARNRGIAKSHGEFIAPVDADDIWFPEAMTKLVNCFLSSDSHTGVVYAWSVIIDENGLLDGRFRCSKIEGNVLGTLICHNFLGNASATMIRRVCLEKLGGYDEGFRANNVQGCEDWDLYLRIAEQCSFRVVPEFLFGYRKLRSGMSSDPESMARSHQHVLKKVKELHRTVPRTFSLLSTSSYYLRIAREYHHDRQPNASFRWLRRALVSSPVFTLLRLGFYSLIIRNVAALLQSRIVGLMKVGAAPSRNTSPAGGRLIQISDLEKKRAAIVLQLAAQSLLHQIAKRCSIY